MRPRMCSACEAMMRWELARLGRVERGVVEQRRGRALDGGERLAQLVAHQPQELGAQALDFVERGEVLEGHHHRGDGAAFAMDGRGVDERAHTAPVGHREHHLLGAHRLVAELPGDGELAQAHLAPVGTAERHHLEELFRWMAGRAQALHDAPRLAVERHRPPAPRIEHHHPDRGGLDEGLEVGPCLLLGAVGAGVGNRRGRLRGEQHEDLLVLACERLAVGLLGEEEVPDLGAAVAHRRALEGPGERRGGLDAERADVAREVGEAQRPRQAAQVLEQARAAGPCEELALLLRGHAREHEPPGRTRLVDGGDEAVARAGERAGALHHLAEHAVEVEACVDAQDGSVQRGGALA